MMIIFHGVPTIKLFVFSWGTNPSFAIHVPFWLKSLMVLLYVFVAGALAHLTNAPAYYNGTSPTTMCDTAIEALRPAPKIDTMPIKTTTRSAYEQIYMNTEGKMGSMIVWAHFDPGSAFPRKKKTRTKCKPNEALVPAVASAIQVAVPLALVLVVLLEFVSKYGVPLVQVLGTMALFGGVHFHRPVCIAMTTVYYYCILFSGSVGAPGWMCALILAILHPLFPKSKKLPEWFYKEYSDMFDACDEGQETHYGKLCKIYRKAKCKVCCAEPDKFPKVDGNQANPWIHGKAAGDLKRDVLDKHRLYHRKHDQLQAGARLQFTGGRPPLKNTEIDNDDDPLNGEAFLRDRHERLHQVRTVGWQCEESVSHRKYQKLLQLQGEAAEHAFNVALPKLRENIQASVRKGVEEAMAAISHGALNSEQVAFVNRHLKKLEGKLLLDSESFIGAAKALDSAWYNSDYGFSELLEAWEAKLDRDLAREFQRCKSFSLIAE